MPRVVIWLAWNRAPRTSCKAVVGASVNRAPPHLRVGADLYWGGRKGDSDRKTAREEQAIAARKHRILKS